MSSEVQAKWMNSSDRSISLLPASFPLSQYSIALTSWFVSASMFLMCAASFSEKFAMSLSSAATVFALNGRSSPMAGSAASALSHSSSIFRR